MKILSILLLVFCLIHFSKQTNNQKIFIFGQNSVPQNCSDPDYNRLLSDHYSSILISRTTCNNVTECYSSDLVRSQRTQGLVVNMLGQVSNLTNDTLSEWVAWNLTLEYTTDEHRGWPLQELAFDDFFGHFKNWDISTRGLTLWKIISEIHRSNLKFGITVYVEEIDDILTWLPDSDLRDLIDVIHLYVKCAINGPEFDNNNYVANITSLFPNAEIILGIYAYPRMTLSNVCVFNESLKDPADLGFCNHTIVLEVAACYQNYTNYTESFCYCTDFQQIKYFNETLALQMNHWANGTVHGIEIYDAGWGLENTTSYCNGSASCVEIREKMRDILLTFNLTDVPPPQSPLKRGFHYIDNDEL